MSQNDATDSPAQQKVVRRPPLTKGDDRTLVERFTPTDLMMLRNELLKSGVDSFQAAEIVVSFLSGRGYGVSSHEARSAAERIEVPGCTPEHIQTELERVARVM